MIEMVKTYGFEMSGKAGEERTGVVLSNVWQDVGHIKDIRPVWLSSFGLG
jgi:hypothetical protein